MDHRVQKVVILMEANPRGTLSLTEMALTVNLSVARLRLLFKAAIGMSPTQYREEYHSQSDTADRMTKERNGQRTRVLANK